MECPNCNSNKIGILSYSPLEKLEGMAEDNIHLDSIIYAEVRCENCREIFNVKGIVNYEVYHKDLDTLHFL